VEKIIRPFTTPELYEIIMATQGVSQTDTLLIWSANTSVDNTVVDSSQPEQEISAGDQEHTAAPSYSSSFQDIVYEERAFVKTNSPVDEAHVWEDQVVLRTTRTYDIGAAQFNMDHKGTPITEADLPWPHKLVKTKEENLAEGYTKTWFNTEWYSWRDNMGRRANSKQSTNSDTSGGTVWQ
jgi:hypothetical protein